MVKRIVAASAFVIAGLALGGALMSLSRDSDPPRVEYLLRWEGLERNADSIEAIVVGCSQGDAVDFGAWDLEGYHLWMLGGDAFEAELIARAALERLDGLELALVVVPRVALHHDNGSSESGHGRRELCYYSVPSLRCIRGDWRSWMRGKVGLIAREDHWASAFWTASREAGGSGQALVDETGFIGRRRSTAIGAAEQAAGSCARALRLIEMQDRSRRAAPGLPSEVESAYLRLALALERRGVRVVFLMTPLFRDHLRAWDERAPGCHAELVRALDRVTSASGAELLDLSRHPGFRGSPQLFRNGDHLNARGARRLTRLLARSLGGPVFMALPRPGGGPASGGPAR